MGYIDILIPLIIGIFAINFPDLLLTSKDATYEKKKSLLKNAGYGLIAVALLYAIVKVCS
jgi:hypothetical protein